MLHSKTSRVALCVLILLMCKNRNGQVQMTFALEWVTYHDLTLFAHFIKEAVTEQEGCSIYTHLAQPGATLV